MIAGRALRHQMILPEQQALYDYWRSKCREGRLPSREDIDPSDLAPYLSTISLMDIDRSEAELRYKFRLAGTDFYDIYKREITGAYIDDLPQGSRCDYWKRVLGRVTDRARPSAGIVRSALSGRTHIARFWLRMPLADETGKVTMILGFDKFVRLSDVKDNVLQNERISA